MSDLRDAGVGVAAIEHMDRRCLELLRADGIDETTGVSLSLDSQMLLLV